MMMMMIYKVPKF